MKELDASEALARRVSAPTALPPQGAFEEPLSRHSVAGVTTLRLANGLTVRLQVIHASPSSGAARAGMRLVAPGGRVQDELQGRLGAAQAMLMTLDSALEVAIAR